MRTNELPEIAAIAARSLRAHAWRDQAACARIDLDVFFPLSDSRPQPAAELTAKAYCQACPVCTDCLNWALTQHEGYGIFGGTTPEERRQMHQPTTRAAVTDPDSARSTSHF